MAKLPKKFTDRVRARLKHFQTIAVTQRARDVSEADTVTLVKDVLAEVFGYDKYAELTSEHLIRGTYCDLAVQTDGTVRFLIEVKSAGSTERRSSASGGQLRGTQGHRVDHPDQRR